MDWLQEATRIRRELHQIPELGFEERETQAYILKDLRALGCFEISVIADTGVKAVWRHPSGERRTLGFRSDIDALPLTEETGLPFASRHPGRMHACGHDGNMTSLLLFARWIQKNEGKINCNIVLLFQPAEESVGGAVRMIQEGALENPRPDELYAMHLVPVIDEGKLGVRAGATQASVSDFDITVTGVGAHAGMPYKGVDAMLAAATLVTQLPSVITKSVDPVEAAVLAVGTLHAGTKRNVIADKAVLECTLRTYSEQVYKTVHQRIQGLLRGLEAAFGVKTDLTEHFYCPEVYNDPGVVERLLPLLEEGVRIEQELSMGGDDMAEMFRVVPGALIRVGCRSEEKGYTKVLHTTEFNFDEAMLLPVVEIYAKLAMRG
jgi:amidohydrolase